MKVLNPYTKENPSIYKILAACQLGDIAPDEYGQLFLGSGRLCAMPIDASPLTLKELNI